MLVNMVCLFCDGYKKNPLYRYKIDTGEIIRIGEEIIPITICKDCLRDEIKVKDFHSKIWRS